MFTATWFFIINSWDLRPSFLVEEALEFCNVGHQAHFLNTGGLLAGEAEARVMGRAKVAGILKQLQFRTGTFPGRQTVTTPCTEEIWGQ